MNFPYYPDKPAQQIPIHLPPSLYSIEACPEKYSPDEGLKGAVNVALLLGQPQGIPRATMQSFLGGYQRLLRGRWEIIASPTDCYRVEVA